MVASKETAAIIYQNRDISHERKLHPAIRMTAHQIAAVSDEPALAGNATEEVFNLARFPRALLRDVSEVHGGVMYDSAFLTQSDWTLDYIRILFQ